MFSISIIILFLNILAPIIFIIIHRQHLLIALLYLELIILSLTIFSMMILNIKNLFFILILLTLGACEARMGLALLISISRTFGSDLIKLLSLNKC